MSDDTEDISGKTWARAFDSINKVGYMDGAADGQSATFQSSFDMGYQQGLSFGMELGFREAAKNLQKDVDRSSQLSFMDPRRINCQICTNSATAQENVVNLYNAQQESNEGHLQTLRDNKINR